MSDWTRHIDEITRRNAGRPCPHGAMSAVYCARCAAATGDEIDRERDFDAELAARDHRIAALERRVGERENV